MQQAFPCPKCGSQIPVGQPFCSNCGQLFEYRCRHCGTAIATSSGFCTNCGGKLSHHTTQHAQPPMARAQHAYYTKPLKSGYSAQRPAIQIGRYLMVVAIIFVMVGAIFVVGTSTQGGSSHWLGGYTFGGQSPPSNPPTTDGTGGQQKPETDINSPIYTADQVIAAAKLMSPSCGLQTRRTG